MGLWEQRHSFGPFRRDPIRFASNVAIFLGACAALWLTSIFGYLLFHTIVEITSISIALAVFMISWSSR